MALEMVEACVYLGADRNQAIRAFGDNEEAVILQDGLRNILSNIEHDDDELINGFIVGSSRYGEVAQNTGKKTKVVRDGKIVIKRQRTGAKKRLSAAQRSALKKARRKANTAGARRKRKKSNKLRKRSSLPA